MVKKYQKNVRGRILNIFKNAYVNGLPYVTNDQVCSEFGYDRDTTQKYNIKDNVTVQLGNLAKEGLIVKPEESIRPDGSFKQDGKWIFNVNLTDEESDILKYILKLFKKHPNQELDLWDLIKNVKFWTGAYDYDVRPIIESVIEKNPEIEKVGNRHYKLRSKV